MPHKLKALLLVTDAPYFLSHRINLARRLQAEGYDVIVATPPGDGCNAISAAGFRHCPVAAGKTRNPLRMLLAVVDTIRLYRRERPDLLVHVSMRPILLGGLAARFAGRPEVVNLITGLGYVFISGSRLLKAAVERAYRWLMRGRVVFQNADDQRYFLERGLCAEQATSIVAGSGIDPARYRPAPEPAGVPVILAAARLLWDKGIGDLVEAGRMLRARGIAHRIVVAGKFDPDNPSAIPELQVVRWSEEGLLEWAGFERDMASAWPRCHVACLPSYREGLPRALIEAAACARPVVTTDVPGCRDVIEHGRGGFLVPPKDPGALADALERLLRDPELREEFGHAARRRALEKFSDAVVMQQMIDLVRDVSKRNSETRVAAAIR